MFSLIAQYHMHKYYMMYENKDTIFKYNKNKYTIYKTKT